MVQYASDLQIRTLSMCQSLEDIGRHCTLPKQHVGFFVLCAAGTGKLTIKLTDTKIKYLASTTDAKKGVTDEVLIRTWSYVSWVCHIPSRQNTCSI
ncbi:Os07g0187350 [Oryza sativa Japonica Group]|uniref:Os07g0187350 protein n=1 Tax=Oryza sativa subsp. japonica TaxID=39947 RepID=A0A0P0X3Q0_ORYSJ|nr:hypothetical protein EE612_037566 [Oryza sativa]BAT00384.1 Os07g0187350 [Oryza sativa Japonica Group]